MIVFNEKNRKSATLAGRVRVLEKCDEDEKLNFLIVQCFIFIVPNNRQTKFFLLLLLKIEV